MKTKHRFWVFSFVLCFLLLPTLGSEQQHILRISDSGTFFLTEEGIQTLWEEGEDAFAGREGFDGREALEHLRSLVSHARQKISDGRRSPGECRDFGFNHHESRLARPGEVLALHDLVERAPRAVVVEVTGSRSGAIGGGLLFSLIEGRVVRVGKGGAVGWEEGTRIRFWRPDYSLTIGGMTFCTRREGFVWGREGDSVLLLLPEEGGPSSPVLTPYVEFPVEGGRALPQPYLFIQPQSDPLQL